MDRREFGQLIAALRKEHMDEAGNRMTQAKLAELAQAQNPQSPVNEVILGKIERGERAMLDDHMLLSLADALKLTTGERREFFLAATGLDDEQIYQDHADPQKALAKALRTLQDIQLPAVLLDSYLDIIAANSAVLDLYNASHMHIQGRLGQLGGLNLLDYIFSSDFEPQRRLMARQAWRNFAVGNVIYFRRVTLRQRMTDYFAALFAQLRRNREFRWFWEEVFYAEKRNFVGGESFQMGSAEGAHYSYLTAPLIFLTAYGNLEIITHIPRNLETAKAFTRMAKEKPPMVHQLSSWPEKQIAPG
jgi:transcriptional regulator with XRE-family HTH domain